MKKIPGLVFITFLSLFLGLFVYPLNGESQAQQAVLSEVRPDECPAPYEFVKKEKEELIGCFGDAKTEGCYCLSRDRDGAIFKRWSTPNKCDPKDPACKSLKID